MFGSQSLQVPHSSNEARLQAKCNKFGTAGDCGRPPASLAHDGKATRPPQRTAFARTLAQDWQVAHAQDAECAARRRSSVARRLGLPLFFSKAQAAPAEGQPVVGNHP